MNFILRAKHWQVFIPIILGMFLGNFQIENNGTLTTVFLLIGTALYFSWIFLVGLHLYKYLPEKIEMNPNLFILNSFIWFTTFCAVMIISDGVGMTFTGLAALPGFYVMFALLHFMMFPVRTLKSIEKGKKADIGESLGDFLLVVFLPIGIWFLQPRINKIANEQKKMLEIE
jgi:hypothetical protein